MNATKEQDKVWMQRALELARQAKQSGEVPVGAVIVRDGKVIGEGCNSVINEHDASAHAEIQAIRAAGMHQQNYRLAKSTIYLTLEPCAMCAGAIVHARIDRVVIATREPRGGAGGSVFNILDNAALNHRCQIEYGIEGAASAEMLKQFFRVKRPPK